MICSNCLQISFGFLSFLFFLSTFLVHWLQKPTRNYAMEYCFFLFFCFSVFFNVLMFKEFAINILRLLCNCM